LSELYDEKLSKVKLALANGLSIESDVVIIGEIVYEKNMRKKEPK
jgi:hypothetical protein